MVISPALAFASPATVSPVSDTKNEIASLNSTAGSNGLLQLSGGRCWQTCSPCGYMDQQVCCDTNCDDNSSSSGYSGGGGGHMSDIALIIGLIIVIVVVVAILRDSPGAPGGPPAFDHSRI